MNLFLSSVVVRHKDGSKAALGSAFIRGSMVKYIILPTILTNAPMLNRMNKANNVGIGIGNPPSAKS